MGRTLLTSAHAFKSSVLYWGKYHLGHHAFLGELPAEATPTCAKAVDKDVEYFSAYCAIPSEQDDAGVGRVWGWQRALDARRNVSPKAPEH